MSADGTLSRSPCVTLACSRVVPFDDFPARFADALESAATRVRAMTADRVAGLIRRTLVIVLVLVLGSTSLVYLVIAAHRALSIGVGRPGSLAILGGLFLLTGLLIWNRGSTYMKGGE